MKTPLILLAALLALLPGLGCGHLDLSPEGTRSRVLHGTVSTGAALPAGAEVTVRLIVPRGLEAPPPTGSALPIAPRPTEPEVEHVIGEHTQQLAAGTNTPVPFRIEYEADDSLLRRGLVVKARVSFGGQVRYHTINAHVITLNSVPYPQNLVLQPMGR